MGKESVVAIILFVMALVGALYLIKNNLEKNKAKNEYSILMDVGSSSTKIYTYAYQKRTDNSLVNVEEKGYYKKEDGVDINTDLSPYFSEVFNDSKVKVMNYSNSLANLSNVPVYIKSTDLRELDQANQETIISGIRKVTKEKSPFLFKDEWARIFNGTEEAFSSWITINYLTGVLKKNDNAKKKVKSTEGSLEVSSDIATIAFVPNGEIKQNKVNIGLGHLSYDLFASSFQGYGQDKTIEKLKEYIVSKAESTKTEIENPCFLNNYKEKYEKDQTKTLFGTGNVEECEKIIKVFTDNILKENTYLPDTTGVKFTAFNAYVYAATYTGVTLNEYIYPTELYDKAKIYCSKTIDKIKEENPSHPEEYLKVYCFTSLYYYHLMVDVYKLNPKEKNVKIAEKINGVTPSWTLGDMIYELCLLPSS